MNKKIWLAVLGILILAISVGGIFAYQRFFTISKATKGGAADVSSIQPKLTYEGAYNGQLYLTGEKTGSEAPFEKLVAGMDRNGVATIIAYFGIEADNRAYATNNVNTIVSLIKDNPGRFTAFYSPGFGSNEVADMVGDDLTKIFKDGLDYAGKAVTGGFMKGVGEIEAQTWQTPLTSPDATQFFDFASQNKLSVMLHTRPDQNSQLEALLQNYPDTTFLLHLFANDFDRNRPAIIDLLQRYQNLAYTIDADHMLFDSKSQPPIGLLYKYQDEEAVVGASKFSQDFDTQFDTLLDQAVARFQPLIAAAPDRVTIGTEMSADYTFEPETYDRTIKFVRHFIARQDPAVQQAIALKNAQRLFGDGVVLH